MISEASFVGLEGQRGRGLWPGYLTHDLAGTAGGCATFKDFVVQEIPAYGPTGEGQHTLFEIEKRGLGTLQAIRLLAHALHVSERAIGSAGLKDAHAVTRQHLSVEGVAPQAVLAAQIPDLRVLWAERHRNRLKIGHLRGNRFTIHLRQTVPEALPRARAILEVLQRRGVPHSFGAQRFGMRHNTHELGYYLLKHDLLRFMRCYLGDPHADDPPEAQQARRLYEDGDLQSALRFWPRGMEDERRALEALALGSDLTVVYQRIPLALKRLYVAAWQAYLFNHLLAARMDRLDHLEPGDLAIKHTNQAFFLVEDTLAEQPRADSLEISPSAPLFGYKVRLAQGEPGVREQELLARHGLTLTDWRMGEGLSTEGERRPLRVPITDVAVCEAEGLVLQFTLPPGAYATNVIGEVTKTEQRP